MIKWPSQRLFKTMRSRFPIFWHNVFPVSCFLTLNLVRLKFKRMGCRPWNSLWDSQVEEPHLSRSLHSISHIHRMSRIWPPLSFECSLCQPSLVALVSVLAFHLSAPDYRSSHSPSGLYFLSGMIFSTNLYSLQQKYFIISRTLTCSKEIYFKIFWRIVSLLTLRGPHQFGKKKLRNNAQG